VFRRGDTARRLSLLASLARPPSTGDDPDSGAE
jgi:hypothetical protein